MSRRRRDLHTQAERDRWAEARRKRKPAPPTDADCDRMEELFAEGVQAGMTGARASEEVEAE